MNIQFNELLDHGAQKNEVLSSVKFLHFFCLPLCGLPVALSLSHNRK